MKKLTEYENTLMTMEVIKHYAADVQKYATRLNIAIKRGDPHAIRISAAYLKNSLGMLDDLLLSEKE